MRDVLLTAIPYIGSAVAAILGVILLIVKYPGEKKTAERAADAELRRVAIDARRADGEVSKYLNGVARDMLAETRVEMARQDEHMTRMEKRLEATEDRAQAAEKRADIAEMRADAAEKAVQAASERHTAELHAAGLRLQSVTAVLDERTNELCLWRTWEDAGRPDPPGPPERPST